jgi:hypothetical protein
LTAISHSRGHQIHFDGNVWRYSDTGAICTHDRPCKRCGRPPTAEGYDACLGHIESAAAACCGHGIESGYLIKERSP